MSKTFAPNTIFVGETSQLTIRINNNDPDTNLTDVSFTDTLPTVTAPPAPIDGSVILATPVSATMTDCGSGAILTANDGGTVISLSNGTITPTVDCIIRVNVTAQAGNIPTPSLQDRRAARCTLSRVFTMQPPWKQT